MILALFLNAMYNHLLESQRFKEFTPKDECVKKVCLNNKHILEANLTGKLDSKLA